MAAIFLEIDRVLKVLDESIKVESVKLCVQMSQNQCQLVVERRCFLSVAKSRDLRLSEARDIALTQRAANACCNERQAGGAIALDRDQLVVCKPVVPLHPGTVF